SGAIALALAKNRPDWSVTAADVSQEALDLASENAKNQNLQIFFKKSDCFTEISEKYDIIVSNPPYISREDESEVGLNVLYSEPHLALFADEDGLAIYRRIAEDAKDYLKDGGKIYLEIGYKQGQSVPELFRKHLPEKKVRTLKDQFGQDRMVVVDDGQD
ncbi:peptide chain release factor N(5)-glutamine methyltransferase, partial [Streptococcus pneumoniae]